jgi:hypothetical protein
MRLRSPGFPSSGTVVSITLGQVGAGERARPLPAGGGTCRALLIGPASGLLPRPEGAGAVRGDIRGENLPGRGPETCALTVERIGLRLTNSAQVRPL